MGIKTNQSAIVGNMDNPGPGNYQPDYVLARESHTKVGFGTDTRGRGGKNLNPGPGAYDAKKNQTKEPAKWVFGTEEKIRDVKTSNKAAPGPGNYDYKSLFDTNVEKNMGTSLASRRPQSAMSWQKNPGPGEYNPRAGGRPKTPSYKIGTENRFCGLSNNESKMVPAPGAYDNIYDSNHKGQNIVFGSEERLRNRNPNTVPGPGNYDPNTVLTKSHAPNFHMGMKTKPIVDQADPKNPGPGTYQPMESLVKESQSVGGKFGHDKRKGMGASEAPGPGAYDMMYEPGSERPKFAFGRDPKLKYKASPNPGPGTYEIKSTVADVQAYQL